MSKAKEEDDTKDESFAGGQEKMVGLKSELSQLKHWLQDSDELKIISIYGMPGIGKTTLANTVYCDDVASSVRFKSFEKVGPDYKLKEFLVNVINNMGIVVAGIEKKEITDQRVDLHKNLIGRKYLIVLDGISSIHVWDELKNYFPDDRKSGSRIILTTTEKKIAKLACTKKHSLKVPFLNENQSWDLFQQIVACPSEHEESGRMVAKNCGGLPLAIMEVGTKCRNDPTVNWKQEAQIQSLLSSMTSRRGAHISTSSIFSIYEQLLPHLKLCFLYMGVFPQNYEIPASKLLKMWVAEGFFKAHESKTMEDIAEECLDELVSKSLVIVCERSSRGKTKTCRIHFFTRNQCVQKAEDEKFFHLLNKHSDLLVDGTKFTQRLCIHNNTILGTIDMHDKLSSSEASLLSLLCVGQQHRHPLPLYLGFLSLRVLDALTVRFCEFPGDVLELVELKYLAMTCDWGPPGAISNLQNLEVFVVHRHNRIKFRDCSPVYLPMEIWELQTLKHLDCMGFELLDPATELNGLEQLLSLSGVGVHSCRQQVFAKMPSLLKLRIFLNSTSDAVETFNLFGGSTDIFRELDSFKCTVIKQGRPSGRYPHPSFPENLKKITLSRCRFRWEGIKLIGELPNLEVLKLRCSAFQGVEGETSEWEMSDGEFPNLKFLLLEDLDLQKWKAEEFPPLLEHVVIRHCYKLEALPEDMIDIDTIKMIEVVDCSPSAMESARTAEVEQADSANLIPKFRIYSSWERNRNLTADLFSI